MIGQQNGGSDNWAYMKPLEIGKHTILSLKIDFSTWPKGYNDVTINSMLFGLPIGRIMNPDRTCWSFL